MNEDGYHYPVAELAEALRKAFVDNKADYIVLYDRRQQFLFESAAFGQEQGWLGVVREVEFDEQDVEWRLRLTPEGKRYFGLPEPDEIKRKLERHPVFRERKTG